MKVTKEDLKRLCKKKDYKGCQNCKYQIEPLRMCDWSEKGGDGTIHFICPRWEKKGVLDQIAEEQNTLKKTVKAWNEAIDKNGYID